MKINQLKLNLCLIVNNVLIRFCALLGSDEPVLGELWHPGEPNFYPHERCTNMHYGRILLADVNCGRSFNYMCEI